MSIQAIPVKLVPASECFGGAAKRGDHNYVAWQEGVNFYPLPMTPGEYINGAEPVAWYRKGKGITVTGAGVSRWADAFGRTGRDLVQGTDTNRPALQSDDGGVLFDGSDNYLATAAFTLNQPATFYALLKQVTWSSGDVVISGLANAAVVQSSSDADGHLGLYAGSATTAENSDLAAGPYGAVCAQFNGASSLIRVNNNAPTTGNPGTNNPGGIVVGANFDHSGAFGNVRFKEIMVFNQAHSTAQMDLVIGYLLSLP